MGGKLGRDRPANVSLIRQAALAALAEMHPLNELQTLRCEVMKLAVDADVVLDLHCDLEAVLHLFVSRRDWPGRTQSLAAELSAEATLAWPGKTAFRIAGPKPLAHRMGMTGLDD